MSPVRREPPVPGVQHGGDVQDPLLHSAGYVVLPLITLLPESEHGIMEVKENDKGKRKIVAAQPEMFVSISATGPLAQR